MLRPQACSFTSTGHASQSQQRGFSLSCCCWASHAHLASNQSPTCLWNYGKRLAFGKSFWQQTCSSSQALRLEGQSPGQCQGPGWTFPTHNAWSRRRLCAKASLNGSEGKQEDPCVAKVLQPGPVNGSPSILRDQNGIPIDGIQGGDKGGNVPTLEKSGSFGESNWESLRANASKAYGRSEESDTSEISADDARDRRASTRAAKSQRTGLRYLRQQYKDWTARVAYTYYNYRKDSWQDVQLFVGLNLVLLLAGGLIKGLVVDALDGVLGDNGLRHFWLNIYDVLVVVFGQELPDQAASVWDQVFSLVVACVGLGAFALVLALVEQVVLENLENNVNTGSKVFESDHILVLGWCENQRDEEIMWKILSQMCQAYRADGGRTVVVLSSRPKVEMEATFRRIIPEERRFGSQFVFRTGSPLVPADLRRVAASAASAVIVVADSSRSPEEADAQSLRTAVLLDELDFPGFGVPDPRKGHILIELKTANATRLLQYSTSSRVMAMPTAQLNARRISRMVRNPVVGSISTMLLSFNSASQARVEHFPEVEGKTFGDLHFWFPDGIVFGIVNQYSAQVKINPPASTFINSGDSLLIIRPNFLPKGTYGPAKAKKEVAIGDWSSQDYVRRSFDEAPMGKNGGYVRSRAMTGKPNWAGASRGNSLEGGSRMGMFMLPLEYSNRSSAAEKVLILGWGESNFMAMLLRELDRGPAALPKGSELTLFNSQENVLGGLRDRTFMESLSVLHVQGNPLDQDDIASKIDISKYKCAIILCDQSWLDPDLDARNGVLMREEGDMLRLDAMILMAQLGVRQLMEAAEFPEINIICEKVAFEGVTRFEDRYRLPLGISVNMSAFTATILAEVAYDKRVLLPYSHLGVDHELAVQDVSAFASEGEQISFWQLQARVSLVGQVLYGFYTIPESPDNPIDIVINPHGDEGRSELRVWNTGDSRRKVITMAPKLKRDPADSVSILTSPSVQNASLLQTAGSSSDSSW